MTRNNRDNNSSGTEPASDGSADFSYQQVIELLRASAEIPPADEAYRLLGHSAEQYQQLQRTVSPEISCQALKDLGFSVANSGRGHRQQRTEAGHGYGQITLPNFFNTRSDVVDNLIQIVSRATPGGKSTIVILSDHPDSGIFSAVEPEHLLVFMSPRQRVIEQPPSADWQEIPGGWRRGRRIIAKNSFLLTRGSNGQLRYSAAQMPKRIEQLAELCAGAWPESGLSSSELQAASDELQRIAACQQILLEIAEYQRQSFPDFDQQRRRLAHNQERIIDHQNRLRRIQGQLAELEAQSAEITEQLTLREPQTVLDRRAKLQQVEEDLAALQELEALDYVAKAELLDPFLNSTALRVETTISTGSSRPLTVTIDQNGVHFQPQVDLDLEARIIAICQKFSQGKFVDALRMSCQQLLSADNG